MAIALDFSLAMLARRRFLGWVTGRAALFRSVPTCRRCALADASVVGLVERGAALAVRPLAASVAARAGANGLAPCSARSDRFPGGAAHGGRPRARVRRHQRGRQCSAAGLGAPGHGHGAHQARMPIPCSATCAAATDERARRPAARARGDHAFAQRLRHALGARPKFDHVHGHTWHAAARSSENNFHISRTFLDTFTCAFFQAYLSIPQTGAPFRDGNAGFSLTLKRNLLHYRLDLPACSRRWPAEWSRCAWASPSLERGLVRSRPGGAAAGSAYVV